MKPIMIQTPLRSLTERVRCSVCACTIATWAYPDGPICSLCFLYESEEGARIASQLEDFLGAVEETHSIELARDSENGQLMKVEQSDHILGVLVMTTRLKGIYQRESDE